MNEKKLFLLNSAKLYQELINCTSNNCIQRFLAFKIILNCMSFEDLINNRQFTTIRPIRDVFLAHKQKDNFFEAFNASNIITSQLIGKLIDFMEINTIITTNDFQELSDNTIKANLNNLVTLILKQFEDDFYSGYRISNNFLCSNKNQIKEISSGAIASVFYRYNSSKELSYLANYFITNLNEINNYNNLFLNSKIDYILHSINMCDCIFKDNVNKFSINGLFEILQINNIGNIAYLEELKLDTNFWNTYSNIRIIRNKLAGHMDSVQDLGILLDILQNIDLTEVFNFVNKLDKAVYETSQSHITIQVHSTNNVKLKGENIITINGIQNTPYFIEESLTKQRDCEFSPKTP